MQYPGKYSSPLESTPSLPTSPVPGGRIDPLCSGYHFRRGDPPSPGVPRDTHEQAPRLHIAEMRGRTNISTTSSAPGAPRSGKLNRATSLTYQPPNWATSHNTLALKSTATSAIITAYSTMLAR